MIGKLKGIVDAIGESHCIIDVNGVGYEVQASARALRNMELGQVATLVIDTHVREDAIRLFGFVSEVERSWFRTLQAVQGVGSKVALAVLGTLSSQDLANAIALGDWATVEQTPGVGKKLALRIVAGAEGQGAGAGGGRPACAGGDQRCRQGDVEGRDGVRRSARRRRGDLGAHQPRLQSRAGLASHRHRRPRPRHGCRYGEADPARVEGIGEVVLRYVKVRNGT